MAKKIYGNIIGGFEFNSKKYTVCTYDDSNNQKIIIAETFKDTFGLHIKNIPINEYKKVIEYFNLINKTLIGDNYE